MYLFRGRTLAGQAQCSTSTFTTLKYFCINHGDQFQIFINVLVGFYCFIWIPMSSTAIIHFYFFHRRQQLLTSKVGTRAERINHVKRELSQLQVRGVCRRGFREVFEILDPLEINVAPKLRHSLISMFLFSARRGRGLCMCCICQCKGK